MGRTVAYVSLVLSAWYQGDRLNGSPPPKKKIGPLGPVMVTLCGKAGGSLQM